jgi:hypothetical protein
MGAACVPGGRLESVLFPELSASDEGVGLEPLAAAAGLSRLLEALYGPSVRHDGPTVFGALGQGATLASQPEPGELAGGLDHVRFFRCRLGTRAYQQSAEGWLAGIGVGARSAARSV